MINCDFCCEPITEEQATDFRCRSFVPEVGGVITTGKLTVVQNMDGDWAACPACAILIYADRWDEVLDRSVERYDGGRMPKEFVRVLISGLHADFRRNRL